MPKLDETWDWGTSAGTGQHPVIPRRRSFRFRRATIPARPAGDRGPAHGVTRPALERLLRRRAPYLVLIGGLACLAVVAVQILAPEGHLGASAVAGPQVAVPTDGSVGLVPTASATSQTSSTASPSSVPQRTPSRASSANPPVPRASPTHSPVPGPGSHPTRTTPPFAPQSIQAEAATNVLSDGPAVVACAPCDGGARVGYIAGTAELIMVTRLPVAGSRTLTVTYETDGLRLLKISANGNEIAERWVTYTGTANGWESPQTFAFATTLPAGPLQLVFYNDVGPAPDIDKVVLG